MNSYGIWYISWIQLCKVTIKVFGAEPSQGSTWGGSANKLSHMAVGRTLVLLGW